MYKLERINQDNVEGSKRPLSNIIQSRQELSGLITQQEVPGLSDLTKQEISNVNLTAENRQGLFKFCEDEQDDGIEVIPEPNTEENVSTRSLLSFTT